MTEGISAEFLYEQVNRLVEDAQAELAEGRYVELGGLDNRIELLCEAVLRLEGDERTRFGDMLTELLGKVSRLGDEIQLHRAKLSTEINNVAQKRKAHVAYQSTEVIDGGRKPKLSDEEG